MERAGGGHLPLGVEPLEAGPQAWLVERAGGGYLPRGLQSLEAGPQAWPVERARGGRLPQDPARPSVCAVAGLAAGAGCVSGHARSGALIFLEEQGPRPWQAGLPGRSGAAGAERGCWGRG